MCAEIKVLDVTYSNRREGHDQRLLYSNSLSCRAPVTGMVCVGVHSGTIAEDQLSVLVIFHYNCRWNGIVPVIPPQGDQLFLCRFWVIYSMECTTSLNNAFLTVWVWFLL